MATDPWQEFRKSGNDPTDIWSEFRVAPTTGADTRIKNDLTGVIADTPGEAVKAYTPQKPQYENVYEPSQDMPGMPLSQAQRPTQNYTNQQMAGAKQGVNIDAPPAVDTTHANFALTKKFRDMHVAQAIQQKFGSDTPIRLGADSKTGDVEYYDKDAAQWKQAGDSFGGKAVNAIPSIGEGLGALGGSFLPWPGFSTAGGAGLGRGAGQAIKNAVGRSMDAPSIEGGQLDPREATSAPNEALKSTAENLALNTVTSGIPTAYRLAVRGKDVVSAAEADSILRSYNANKKYVDEIEAATGKKYPANVARIAGLPDANGQVNPAANKLLANEPLLLQYPELAAREVERRANKQNVVELYWSTASKNPDATSNITQENWQNTVKQYYDLFKEGRLGPYQEQAEQAVLQAQKANQGSTVGAMDTEGMGQVVRDVVMKAHDASAGKKAAAWANYEDKAKYIPGSVSSEYQVPTDEALASTMNILNDLKKKSLLSSQASQAERYTPKGMKEPLSEEDTALMDSLGTKYEKGGTVDLAMLDRTIKDLNEEANQATKGTVEGSMSSANRNLLLGNLKKARASFFEDKPELATALEQANAETARHGQEFKESFLATFLVRNNAYGDMRIAEPSLLDRIMTNRDKAGAQQLADLTNGEPGAKQAILDYADAYYNTKFTKNVNGVLQYDNNKHQKFVREVLPALEPFFSPEQFAKIGEVGGLAKQVLLEKQKWQAAQKAWSALDEGRLGSKLTSESLVNSFFNADKSDKNFRFIKSYLGDDAVKATQDGIMATIVGKAKNQVTGKLDVNKLAGLINPIRDRFETYFGSAKLNQIDNLIKTAQEEMVDANVGKPILSGDTFLSRVARPVLGPLSSENRKITFLRDLRQKNIAYKVEEAMYNPNELERLAKEIRGRRADATAKSRINAALVGLQHYYDDTNR